jgi:hypothetical protein
MRIKLKGETENEACLRWRSRSVAVEQSQHSRKLNKSRLRHAETMGPEKSHEIHVKLPMANEDR